MSTMDRDEKKRKRRTVLIFRGENGEEDLDFKIDEDDYRVMGQIVNANDLDECKTVLEATKEMVEIKEIDGEHRVYKLRIRRNVDGLPECILKLDALEELVVGANVVEIPQWIGKIKNLKVLELHSGKKLNSVPNEIGNLMNLHKLDLSYSCISSLPGSIGMMTNLKYLNLAGTKQLKSLPNEISKLVNLNKLILFSSSISSLPNSIGQLQNLTELDLSSTKELQSLPDDIGNMANLTKLTLYRSSISSLPNSIGQLQNLRDLDLSSTKELKSLPDEIGNMANLNKLNLCYSSISSLPNSIGQLQNLRDLDMSCTKELKSLPDEIGNITNLIQLNLRRSIISSLPNSIGQLRNLRLISLNRTSILQSTSPNQMLWNAVRQCRSLGCIGREIENEEMNSEWQKLNYCLIRNRARSRVVFGNDDGELILPPALWPLILYEAKRAFDQYPLCQEHRCSCRIDVTQSDAIFQLLVDRGAKDVFFHQN